MRRFSNICSVGVTVLIIGALVGCGTGNSSSRSNSQTTTISANSSKKVVTVGYIRSLHTADQFLNAWLNRDWTTAKSLVTKSMQSSGSKQSIIGLSDPQNWSYEITYANHPNSKTYVFHVWLYDYYPSDPSSFTSSKRQKPLTLDVIKTQVNGKTKWLVNNIPS